MTSWQIPGAPAKGWLPLILLSILTLVSLILSIVMVNLGLAIIFVPITLACMYYAKRGFVFSVFLVCIYFFLTITLSSDPNVLQIAAIRVPFFILVAGVITYLSLQRTRGEELLLKKTEELHAANEQLAAAGEELKSQFDALVESERSTRLSEERLIMAQEIGGTGCWEYSFETDKIWGSAEGLRIFGFPPVAGDFPINDIEACIPERERVHQALVDLISVGKKYNLEYAINPADDSTSKVIHSIARLEKDAHGNPARVVGVIQDITERKRAENALLRVNQKFNVLSQLTRKDLTNQTFVLNSYLELVKNQLTGQDLIIETVEKGVDAVRLIHETIEYSKDYQDMGVKPPKWQNIKMALLFGLSHISIGNIQHSIETGDLEIFADSLLEKVCQRLFENSVKHGGHVTRIRVWHTITPDGATVIFEDDGIGIPLEQKEQIFLRSEGIGRASMRSLIFAREILDITGITIKETGEPGKGARFEMMVPKGMYR
jgi:signal transduction histidine kinase